MKSYQIQWILAAFTVTGLNAQVEKPAGDRRPPPPLLLGALDADKNGELSAAEIDNSAAVLGGLDKDHDGALSQKEMAPPPPKGKKSMGPPPPKGPPQLVKALDLDKDGALSADEIEDAPLSLKTLDKNRDGKITPKELNPGKPPAKESA